MICRSSQPIDAIRSRILELRNVYKNSKRGTEKSMNDVEVELVRKINWISSEWYSNLSSMSSEELNEISEQLKKELGEVEGENTVIEHEIEKLQRRRGEDYNKMEREMEKLCCSLEFIESQIQEKSKEHADDHEDSSSEHSSKFKMLELSHQIEKNKTTLKSLQDLDYVFKRFETVEKIDDALTGLKGIEIDGNSIRLSLKTYIPYLETVLCQQDIENVIEPLA